MLLKLTIPPALVALYGPENPLRAWIYVLTVLAVLCLPRNTRRFGAIGFVSVFIAMFIWNFLNTTYKQMTPSSDPPPKARPTPYAKRL
jgi:hypothetical protein